MNINTIVLCRILRLLLVLTTLQLRILQLSSTKQTSSSIPRSSCKTGYKAVISFYVDATGATRAEKGEEVPTAGTLSFKNEEIPLYYDGDEALIGFIIVANATGSQFVGGTTQLDAVGVTTTYINNFGWVGM